MENVSPTGMGKPGEAPAAGLENDYTPKPAFATYRHLLAELSI